MKLKTLSLSVVLSLLFLVTAGAEEIFVPGFDAWKLTGLGKMVDSKTLEVVGKDKATSFWRSPNVNLRPGGFYRYTVSIRGADSQGGCLPCGIESFSRDYNAQKNDWKEESFCFRLQETRENVPLRVGQWESAGTFQFRNIKLESITPVLKEVTIGSASLILGDGESIRNGVYHFSAWFGEKSTNIHRPFVCSNATFNSNRWCLYENAHVLYRFDVTPSDQRAIEFDGGTVRIGCCHHASGEGTVEVSRDGETRWTELGRIDNVGSYEFPLPQIAFPMERIYLRIRGLKSGNLQVESIVLEAPLVGQYQGIETKKINVQGETLFASSTGTASDAITLTADGNIRVRKSDGNEQVFPLKTSASPGEIEQKFTVDDRMYALTTSTHPLHRSDYGYALSAPSGLAFWWCEADWKISRDRTSPAAETRKPIEMFAAKNDFEAFQLVLRSTDGKPIKGLTAKATVLTGLDGATISSSNIEILYAYYHFVHSKTDGTGLIDFWPDALPPLDKPLDIEAGKNQPIWVKVKIPSNAPAGKYCGEIQLNSEDGKFHATTLPYTVNVWDFALPKENHHETAYGFNPNQAANYHNAKTDEDKRRVVEMYLQCFADNRISIYRPTPFDNFDVKWVPNDVEPEKSSCEIDFSRYEKEMSRVLDKFPFTNFTVPGQGLGGGTFHERYPPSIEKYGEDTPQYHAMMTDYYTKLVDFLKQKGWLDKAYVYWFDEPAEKDYEFVAAGTAKLQKYAPGLARMMTVMLSDDKLMPVLNRFDTSFDIWCPVSHHFQEDLAQTRMDKGERFWWYVCTGPKAPYCTLFIDHPATELRIWHWQAWQRGIVGSLVWESTYWHSGAAFPNNFQNPYADPMGYVSGYSTPMGTKRHWGNGDGRFIYPPLAAAVPGLNDGKPVFDKPVSSIRWEMIREGIEDYEMFYKLRELLKSKAGKLSEADRKVAETLSDVPESVTKTMTDFSIDPRPLLEHRRKVGAMIEKMEKQ